MNVKDDVEKDDNRFSESRLSDLSPAADQADSTKGGEGRNGNLQIGQFYGGATTPTSSAPLSQIRE